MRFITQIKACMPASPGQEIPWEQVEGLLAGVCFSEMKNTRQNPVHHGEGDVYAHTRMVCRELTGNPAFFELPDMQKTALFLAAVLHDIGKVRTTRLEDGSWVSPYHSAVGSRIARAFLWSDCSICGTRDAIGFRETVCALIRYHMLPGHLMDQEDPGRKARTVAAVGETAAGFSWRLLCMLTEADVQGRIAEDIPKELERIELARMAAEEAGCLDGPYPFADGFTRRAYLAGRNVQPDQTLYDDTWGEVILLSGLPGTGKDTWIRQRHPDLPVVSLDGLRTRLGVRPTDSQGAVIQAAQETAREHLRAKRPFIWNATDLTREKRQKLVALFERYGARVRIVYLETGLETRTERNQGRAAAVPESAVARMLEKTEPPTPDEAQTVEWICT